MITRTVFATTLLATLVLGGCSAGTGKNDNPSTDPPLGPNASGVAVTILGAGSVTYNAPAAPDCASDGSAPVSCPPVRYDGGSGTIAATAATGWRFDGWSLVYGDKSPNAMSNPKSATQTILPGTSVALTATFVPLVHPIKATFTQETFSTKYVVDVDNPDLDIVKVVWSGPSCGTYDPKEGLGAESTTTFEMTWQHPHDPRLPGSCDATTDHKDVTVTATITIKDKTFVCEYQGADTGEGKACK